MALFWAISPPWIGFWEKKEDNTREVGNVGQFSKKRRKNNKQASKQQQQQQKQQQQHHHHHHRRDVHVPTICYDCRRVRRPHVHEGNCGNLSPVDLQATTVASGIFLSVCFFLGLLLLLKRIACLWMFFLHFSCTVISKQTTTNDVSLPGRPIRFYFLQTIPVPGSLERL